ncbi:MAG TPA: hypothetical protein VLS94_07415 [Fusibacter sp.]|nr:hypothetical protein [Fusibacter sp.]
MLYVNAVEGLPGQYHAKEYGDSKTDIDFYAGRVFVTPQSTWLAIIPYTIFGGLKKLNGEECSNKMMREWFKEYPVMWLSFPVTEYEQWDYKSKTKKIVQPTNAQLFLGNLLKNQEYFPDIWRGANEAYSNVFYNGNINLSVDDSEASAVLSNNGEGKGDYFSYEGLSSNHDENNEPLVKSIKVLEGLEAVLNTDKKGGNGGKNYKSYSETVADRITVVRSFYEVWTDDQTKAIQDFPSFLQALSIQLVNGDEDYYTAFKAYLEALGPIIK